MSAIGGKVGNAIYIKEIDENTITSETRYYAYSANASMNAASSQIYDRPLSFAPEKVRMVILARFDIQ